MFGGMFGRYVEINVGRIREVLEGMLRGFQTALGKVVRGFKIYKKPVNNLCKPINPYATLTEYVPSWQHN